jgi:carotenoid cleavage dioxygenase
MKGMPTSSPPPVDNPYLKGQYAPLREEFDLASLPVSGRWPRDLRGTLYRNGPNPRFPPPQGYHWFFGDGMLHAFRIDAGRISYRNRWVRTPKWELEDAAGLALDPKDPRRKGLNSTLANTSVVWYSGRLLALEEAHAPFEVDPVSLDSRGYHTFDGQLSGSMTAHPKVDPVTGELVFFGYAAPGPLTPDIAVGVMGSDGRLRWASRFVAPYASMVHDFLVTQRWIVVPIFPLTFSRARAEAGGPVLAWEPEKETHLAVIPRGGGEPRWFQADPFYVFHAMNAYDDGSGRVICHVMEYRDGPGFPRPDGTRPDGPPNAVLVRWTLDVSGDRATFTRSPIDDRPGEFPRIDERYACVPYRHAYFRSDAGAGSGEGIAYRDVVSGAVAGWHSPDGDACGEPVFVPRGDGASEGDGWLLSTVYRGQQDRSDLLLFDAQDIAAGPVASAHVPHRVPAGFHGMFRRA